MNAIGPIETILDRSLIGYASAGYRMREISRPRPQRQCE